MLIPSVELLPKKPSTEELKSKVLAVKREEYLIKSIEEISMVEFLPISFERLVDLRRKTELEECLQQLKHIINIGWPENKEDIPPESGDSLTSERRSAYEMVSSLKEIV